jgi:hypothetical protein
LRIKEASDIYRGEELARPRDSRPIAALRPGIGRWFAPDLALVASIAMVALLFWGAAGATSLFRDSDTGWHIRNGERILSTGLLPRVDPFSFSKAGTPWVAWEWGADVLMGATHLAAGLGGVALLYGLVIGASVWMWFRLNWAAGGNYFLACLFAAPMVSTTALHWLARPHLLSWLFLASTVWFCEKLPVKLTWKHFVVVAAVSAVWANVHASFFFAPAIGVIYAAGAYLRPRIWEVQKGRWGAYMGLSLVALAGTLVNPNGWALHRHVIDYLLNSALLDRVAEFQSFNFHGQGAMQVVLALAICFGGAFASLAARRLDRFLLSILLLTLALTSARALPVAALLLLPLANGSITELLVHAKDLKPRVRRKLDDALDYGDRLRTIDSSLRGFALIPVIALVFYMPLRLHAAFPANVFPVAASESIAALPTEARVFAPDLFGGYLIYRFNGARKVFFDGRSDFYGADFMKDYIRIVQVKPGWRKEFSRWHFTHALLPADHSLIPALEAAGWTELHRDKTAVLLTEEPGR